MQDFCSHHNGSAAVGSEVWNDNKRINDSQFLQNHFSIPEASTGAASAPNSIPSTVIFSSNFCGVKGASDNFDNASTLISAHLQDSLSSASQANVPSASEAADHGEGASTICRSLNLDNSQHSNSQSAQFFSIAGQSHFASSPNLDLSASGIVANSCERTQGTSHQIPHIGAKIAHPDIGTGISSLQQDKNCHHSDMQTNISRTMDSSSRYNNDVTTSSHNTNISMNTGFMSNNGNNMYRNSGTHSNNNLQFGANTESNNQNTTFGAQYNNNRAKSQTNEANFNSPYSGWPTLNTSSTSVPSSNGWIVPNLARNAHDGSKDIQLKDEEENMVMDNEMSYSSLIGGTDNEDSQQNTGKDMTWGVSRLGMGGNDTNSGSNGWNNQCPPSITSGSNTWNNSRQSSTGDNSEINMDGHLIGATGGSDYAETKQNGGNNFKQDLSRPLPPRLGLLGGGESSLTTSPSGWANGGNTGSGNSSWVGGTARNNNGSSDIAGSNGSGMSPPKPHNSWAQAAGKGLNQSSGNNGHENSPNSEVRDLHGDNSVPKAQNDCNSEIKAKAAVTEGWGQTPINQDAPWDLPLTPPTPKDPVLKEPPPSTTPVWRAPVNNGTEIWENNLRINKGVPTPVTTTTPPWGHTPSTNIGGHWGDDDSSNNMWGNAPSSNPTSNSNWSESNNPTNAMWGPNSGTSDKHWGGANPNSQPGTTWNDGVGDPDNNAVWMTPVTKQRNVGNWSPASTPKKEMPPSGWELPSPPTNRRPPVTNYDDGTSAWGNPQRQGKVSHWKDMPSAKPIMNSNNGNTPMMPPMSGNMQVSGPGMIRLPSGSTVNNKADMEAVWNKAPVNRNSRWQDMPSQEGTNIGTWGEENVHSMKNMQGNSNPGNNAGWGEQPNNSMTGYWGNKPKSNSNWADGQVDTSSWLGPAKQGGKPLTRDLIWASKQFRLLIEHGFKREDAENALRNNNMNFDDALVELRTNVPIDGNMMDLDGFHGRKVRPANLQEDLAMSDNVFDMNFGASHGSSFQTAGNFQTMGNMGAFKPQVKGPSNTSALLNSTLGASQSNLGSIGNFTPVIQKLLQQQSQTNLQQFTPQMNNQSSRGGQHNFPSTAQLRHLVQQIQMAVQAGHLNPQILNQPLAPQTLHLLYQLLQQIKVLHTLQQPTTKTIMGGGGLQLSVQITQTKQRIINLQNQINAQQAVFLKQQVPVQPAQLHAAAQGTNDLFKEPLPSIHNEFRDLSIKDLSVLQTHQQSRLNQWKLPSFDKEEFNSNDFSRAPGPSKNPSGPNLHPLLGQSDSAWSRSQGESGWPESTPDSVPVSSVPSNLGIGNSGATLETKESSPPSSGPSTSSASSYNLTDLVPEFEPGKPWKGIQMKNIEDDPHITPGSIARPPLAVNTNKESDLIWNAKSSSASTSSNDTNSLVSNTWTNSSSGLGSKNGKTNWSTNDSNSGSDMWGPKARGLPPGMFAQGWDKQGNNTFLLLRNLTPQIDGSTLKTLCMQHGPLVLFHLSLNHGIALVRYSTKEEASKAQSALNNCVLGNTTILADIPNDAEVSQYLTVLSTSNTQSGYFQWSGSQQGSSSGNNNTGGNVSTTRSSNTTTYPFGLPTGNSTNNAKQPDTTGWNNNNLPSPLWSMSAPSSGNSLWGMPQPIGDHDSSTNSSLNRFLPDDLLGGESM